MKILKTRKTGFFLFAALLVPFSSARGAAIDTMRGKIQLESQIEERVRQILRPYLGWEDLTVVARVALLVKKAEEGGIRKWDESEDTVLPGVPAATSMTKKIESADAKKTSLRIGFSSISVWVIAAKPLSKDKEEKVRRLVSDALELSPEAGDTITIESSPSDAPLISGGTVAIGAGAIIAVAALAVFAVFLYGPLRGFLKRFNENLAAMGAKTPGQNKAGELSGEEGAGGTKIVGGIAVTGSGSSSVLTFGSDDTLPLDKYVNKNNVEDLRLILGEEPPDIIAKVIQRIPPKMALAAIPPYKMNDVLAQFLNTEFETPEKVKALTDRIKDKMAGSFGGPARLGSLVQVMEKSAQDNVIGFLKGKDLKFAAAVENRFFKFEDLLCYDEVALRRICRKAGVEAFTGCLKNCGDDTAGLFYEKLGPAIKELITARRQTLMAAAKGNEAELSILGVVEQLSERGLIPALDEVKQARSEISA